MAALIAIGNLARPMLRRLLVRATPLPTPAKLDVWTGVTAVGGLALRRSRSDG